MEDVLRADGGSRVWSKVAIGERAACWEWSASRAARGGYGQLRVYPRTLKAHRVAFFLHPGHWPRRWCLHHCDNPPCVNPAHLYDGSCADNARDAVARGRQQQRRGERQGQENLLHCRISRKR
jgi:hypothetical protein